MASGFAVLRLMTPDLESESDRAVCAELVSVANAFETRKAKIEGDRNLSDEGKTNAIRAARREAEAATSACREKHLASLAPGLAAALAQVDQVSAPPVNQNPGDISDIFGWLAAAKDLVRQSRYGEIRRSLEGLDPLEIEMVYLSAPLEVRQAIESGPPRIRPAGPGRVACAAPWISAEIVEQHRMGAAQVKNPAALEHLRRVQSHRSTIERCANILQTALREAVPRGLGDPVSITVNGIEEILPTFTQQGQKA